MEQQMAASVWMGGQALRLKMPRGPIRSMGQFGLQMNPKKSIIFHFEYFRFIKFSKSKNVLAKERQRDIAQWVLSLCNFAEKYSGRNENLCHITNVVSIFMPRWQVHGKAAQWKKGLEP